MGSLEDDLKKWKKTQEEAAKKAREALKEADVQLKKLELPPGFETSGLKTFEELDEKFRKEAENIKQVSASIAKTVEQKFLKCRLCKKFPVFRAGLCKACIQQQRKKMR